MLQPKRTKFRKQQKGRNRGLATARQPVSFGEYGLKATGRGRIHRAPDRGGPACHDPPREARRQDLDPGFPDKPITKKPLEVRQGKGKGNVEYWVAQIQPGRMLYEMEGVDEEACARGVPPGRRQAAGQDDLRERGR